MSFVFCLGNETDNSVENVPSQDCQGKYIADTVYANKRTGRTGGQYVPRCVIIDYSYNLAPSFSNSSTIGSDARSLLWRGPTQLIQRYR